MKQNIYVVVGGKKILLAENVLTTSYTNSSGGVFHYYVSVSDWLSFKNSSEFKGDGDFNYYLVSGKVPGRVELVGGPYLIETVN